MILGMPGVCRKRRSLASAAAFWSAPGFRRFRGPDDARKAPEGWSTPGRWRDLPHLEPHHAAGTRSVLECAGPPALSWATRRSKSSRGLEHSRTLARERGLLGVTFNSPHESPLLSQAHCRLCFCACHFEREVAELDVSGGFDWGGWNGRCYDDERAPAS